LRQMRKLVELGNEISVILPEGRFEAEYRAAGVLVHRGIPEIYSYRGLIHPKTKRWFRSLVEEIRPDIIHSHFVLTTLLMRVSLGAKCAIPRIFQVPGPLHLEHPLLRALEIGCSDQNDYWIATCQWTKERYLQSHIDGSRVFLSYYGTDLEHFTPRQKGRLRSGVPVNEDTKIVGMVSYIYPPKRWLGQRRGLKGHEDFVDALALCLQKGHDVLGLIVGGAWGGALRYEEKVRAYAKDKCGEHIVMLGTRSDVPELYADLDVVVHPSHSENVGGAAESLMLGVPTIATQVGGFPDLVRNGETGWLVPPKCPGSLANAIISALSDSHAAKGMAIQGQALARYLFNINRTAQEIDSIYREILGHSRCE